MASKKHDKALTGHVYLEFRTESPTPSFISHRQLRGFSLAKRGATLFWDAATVGERPRAEHRALVGDDERGRRQARCSLPAGNFGLPALVALSGTPLHVA